MKRKTHTRAAILLFLLISFIPGETYTTPGIAYGIISRKLTAQSKVVIIPTHGRFIKNTEIKFYNGKGQYCCSGTVQNSYPDIAYVIVESDDLSKLRKGYLVSFNGEDDTISSLSSYSMNINMVMENCIRKTHSVPPNDIVLDYIHEDKMPVTFHHYSHNYRCTTCHHNHHDAIDTRCRSCHNSETASLLFSKKIEIFREHVKTKCLECHIENDSIVAGWKIR